jgi:hypothetical protein
MIIQVAGNAVFVVSQDLAGAAQIVIGQGCALAPDRQQLAWSKQAHETRASRVAHGAGTTECTSQTARLCYDL